LHTKRKKGKSCEEILETYVKENDGQQEAILALAQLYAQQQRHELAVEVLAKLPLSSRAQPKTTEAIVSLHQRQKKPDKAAAALREAVKYWSEVEQDDEAEHTLGQVLRMAARVAVQVKDRAFAAEVFQLYLEKIDGSDTEALCGLVQALAVTDPERAAEYAQRLKVPSFDHLDAEELESVPIPKVGAMLSRKKGDKEASNEEEAALQAEKEKEKREKKKQRKKKRYPKDFDPENPGPPPDPERWLPKRERTEFKKKMRKKDKQLLRGPQGAMVTSEDFRKQGPSTAQVEASKDNSTGPRKQAGRKKGK